MFQSPKSLTLVKQNHIPAIEQLLISAKRKCTKSGVQLTSTVACSDETSFPIFPNVSQPCSAGTYGASLGDISSGFHGSLMALMAVSQVVASVFRSDAAVIAGPLLQAGPSPWWPKLPDSFSARLVFRCFRHVKPRGRDEKGEV